VINIITSDPLRERVNSVTVQGGTQDYSGGSVVATRKFGDNAGLRVSLGGFRARDFAPGELPPPDRDSRKQSPKIGALNIDGRVRLASGAEAFAEASLNDGRYAEKAFNASFDSTTLSGNVLRAGISADSALGLLSFSAYRNAQKAAVKAANVDGELRTDINVVEVSDLVKHGVDHTFRFGLEYRRNSATSPEFFQGGTIGYAVYAASVMWNWRIASHLSWTNAVRVDSLKLKHSGSLIAGTGVTPADYNASARVIGLNSGLVYNVTPNDTLRLMVARGVQFPSLVDFGEQISAGGGQVVFAGNPGLRPSTVDSIELDYDTVLPSLGSSLRIAAYAQRNKDLISQPFGAPPVFGRSGLLLKAANVGSSDAAGVEVGIRGAAGSGLRWQASYVYAITTDDTLLNRAGFINSAVEYAHSTPRHVVLGGLGYTRGRLEMDLFARWQSSFRDFETGPVQLQLTPVEVRNYLLLSARVGYRLTDRITAAFSVQQFNSARQLQTAGPPVERRAIVSVSAEF
jgi:outer membrane receptor for ferrienterochelin and colicins